MTSKGVEAVAAQYNFMKIGYNYCTEKYVNDCKRDLYTIYQKRIDMIPLTKEAVFICEMDYPPEVIQKCITVPGMYNMGQLVYLNLIEHMTSCAELQRSSRVLA